MNEDHQQQEMVHYMDGGYSYPVVSDCFGHFFDGVSAAPLHYAAGNMGQMQEQESAYWSMHMNSFRYGPSGTEDMYCGVYVGSGPAAPSVMDFGLRAWDYSLAATPQEPVAVDVPVVESAASAVDSVPQERSVNDQDAESAQAETDIIWQDGIDPDNMTYEELLDLGEALGSENRGLSKELIDMLPTSKHKAGGIFSRRKSGDRCVICQMRYKRGDRLINLPCKHAYHTDCGSKWLSINKTCPVCNTEVFGNESTQQQ